MDKTTLQKYETILFELNVLHNKVRMHIKERTSADGYVYAETYCGWLNEYNVVVEKYNNLTGASLSR